MPLKEKPKTTKKIKETVEVKKNVPAVIIDEENEIEEHVADVKVDPEVEAIEKMLPSKKKAAAQPKHIDDPEEWARSEEERDTWD